MTMASGMWTRTPTDHEVDAACSPVGSPRRSLSDGVFPSVRLADLAHRSQSVVRQALGGPGRWERCDFQPPNLVEFFVSITGCPPPVELLYSLPVVDLINNRFLATILGQLFFRARLMTNLPVFTRWSASKKKVWTDKLDMFAELLIAVLHRRSVDVMWADADLAVVNVFILMQCLPSTILLHLHIQCSQRESPFCGSHT